MIATPGTCRFCGCNGDSCSVAPFEAGDTCGWVDKKQTVCSAKGCQIAWDHFKKRERDARRVKRLTTADVHAMICGRKPSRKKEDAA